MISTLSGGVLGVSSTLVVEAFRSKRDQKLRHLELRRTAYVRYLTALTDTETALQTLALSRPTPVANGEVVAAFRSQGVIAARYEVFLVAPPVVYDAARDAYNLLRAQRVAIATTDVAVGDDSSEWQALHIPYDVAFRHLRAVMRDSLGSAGN
ncbi:hypothetical protein [Streptomyces caeruleatus]|uniref:hypothetical protein n=1 Tax=Streptomyces caeruleatus TaxID=661399 RepID=UPI00131AD70D|nr:hypothetical protein [Streptomyces caeruleatus]